MKARALLILFALIISIAAPISVTSTPAGSGTFLITLDICDAANAAVSGSTIFTGIHECTFTIMPAGFAGLAHIVYIMFQPFVITVPEEHPPKI